jgi:GNAT superfamily N-acetyltransferase
VIRALRDEDFPELARLWRELRPDTAHSERGLRHVVASFPPRAEGGFWVVEDDSVVAWAVAHRRWWRATNSAYFWIGVVPHARGRGLGGRLYELALDHVASLGIERVHSDVVGDAAGERFLARRGFVRTRTIVISAVDPHGVDGTKLAERRRRAESRIPRKARAAALGGRERRGAGDHGQRRAQRVDARDQPAPGLRAVCRAAGLRQGALSGNGFRARAGSTCAVTQTGVVT